MLGVKGMCSYRTVGKDKYVVNTTRSEEQERQNTAVAKILPKLLRRRFTAYFNGVLSVTNSSVLVFFY